jgi:hypothetical protein
MSTTPMVDLSFQIPEQDPLIILLVMSGVRGLVRLPHDKDECDRITLEYGDFLRQREDTIRELIANRTLDEEMQGKIFAALLPMLVQGQ